MQTQNNTGYIDESKKKKKKVWLHKHASLFICINNLSLKIKWSEETKHLKIPVLWLEKTKQKKRIITMQEKKQKKPDLFIEVTEYTRT